ncbi:MAG: ATP-binding protein [Planctomycetota bacterium]
MIIAVASGKGGTGKTTIAVNLALVLSARDKVMFLDCDVEEPNAHIFLKPDIQESESVGIPVPSVDETRCNVCGECSRFCQYGAIVCMKTKPLVFPEICHGCGGCARVCPQGAITETDREVGVVETGTRGPVRFVQGRLNVGHPMSPPLIRAVKKHVRNEGISIIDCPPGTSCPVIAALRGCDFVILVTEPTPFGLHDLALAVETVRQLDIPFGVVINRADAGDSRVEVYCRKESIRVLLKVSEDRRVAEAYSRGEVMVEVLPEYRDGFERLWVCIKDAASGVPDKTGRIPHADV